MKIIENKDVLDKIHSYPENAEEKLLQLRDLIFEVAKEMRTDSPLEETLKWGEPSYLTKNGSTIRIDWNSSKPDQYAMYFHCKTRLVDTFKELYADTFRFEGNRAIIFSYQKGVAKNELKHCIYLSLNYHKLKHLPLLGA